MKWTFGIITDGQDEQRLSTVIRSIGEQCTDDFEIVVVGADIQTRVADERVIYVSFDESVKNGWITRKKNIVTERARYDNICMLHDYVSLLPDWTENFDRFGDDWLTCITPIRNLDGTRFRDWCVIYNDAWMNPPIDHQTPPSDPPGRLLRYGTRGHERWQYYSGAYFCAKRSVLQSIPLDEKRTWGQGEDVQWSRLIYQKYGPQVFQFNQNSYAKFLKQKDIAPWEMYPEL